MSGQVDDPALSVRIAERQQELAAKPVLEMTVAERLTLRALDRRETLVLESSAGPIEIEVRLPLAAETREIGDLQARAVRAVTEIRRRTLQLIGLQEHARESSGDELANNLAEAQRSLDALQAQVAADNRRLLELIADLCVDESISAEFLGSGLFAPEDIGGITQWILRVSQERAAEARNFRSK